MQSLKVRFNGKSQEVVDYAKTWGIWKAMDKYQVKDYLAFRKFMVAEGEKDIPLSPVLGGIDSRSWAEDLLDAFTSKIHKMEAENLRLKEELHQLNIELEYHKGKQASLIEPKIQALLAVCRTEET